MKKLLTYRFTVDTAERRPLTAGAVNTDADVDAAISPDGRRLAFVRIITLYSSRVMWMPLGAEYRPAAQPREIGTPEPVTASPVWSK
jgi:hypothetical protein